MSHVAIVMLACRDYEALELTLACHTAYGAPDVPLFILQNCRGDYDTERSLAVAYRYAKLFPKTVTVVDDVPPGFAYHSIAALLSSPRFQTFDLICKVDDDAFPIAPGWLEKLIATFYAAEAESGQRLAYVTPLINNNTWGFEQVMQVMGLTEDYFRTQARIHLTGDGKEGSLRVRQADEIGAGVNGTVWGYPYLARWLHDRTSARPDELIKATADLTAVDVPAAERYSIGCILFRRELWRQIDTGQIDDEHMMHMHCAAHDLRIVCDRSVPFVHLAYFTHREENRDVVETLRRIYEPRLHHSFPIAVRQSRLLEIEARMRWLEAAARNSTERLDAGLTQTREIIAGLEQRLASVDDRSLGIDGRILGIDGRILGIDGRLSRIDERMSAVADQLASFRTDMASIADRLDHAAAAERSRRRKTLRSRFKRAWRRLTRPASRR